MAKAKKDIRSFDKLYEYYLPRIFAYCLNRLANRETAEDITSQVFVGAVEGIKRFDLKKRNKFGTWLYRVAHNKIVDYYRKKKPKFFGLFGNEVEEDSDPDEKMDMSQRQKQIVIVLKKLKPRYQQIISLRFYSEMKNEEIAQTMRMKKSNVALVLHRALRAFRSQYTKMHPESEIFNLG
ncbi:sigma-70 family RNA polymerase sigma factor [Candidatus Dojkabacteria bacterium]|nr:sigma-70 family RNA polymerase sigma factor [Candidatus Dojkabacteria bacterium]